jgi:outer membrane protein
MMNNRIKIIGIALVFMGCMGISMFGNVKMALAVDMKIGWVNLQRVINASEEGKRAQEGIQQRADEYTLKADQMKAEIEALAEDLKTQADVLTPSARREKQDAITKLEVEYNRFVQDSREELGRSEQRALAGLLEDIGRLVVEYGEQEGFAVILEAGNILYGAKSIEVTDDIIALYNSRQ